jgi:hypothetical protein
VMTRLFAVLGGFATRRFAAMDRAETQA